MKKPFTTNTAANYLAATILVVVPFHAFLTVWASTLVGHYTALRLWDDTLLAIIVLLVTGWLLREKPLRQWLSGSLLVRLIAAYAGLTLLLGLIAYLKGDVTPKALAYGVLVNLRYLVWLVATALIARRSDWLRLHWRQLLLVPAAVVVVFALLQFTILPAAFLGHFGYNAATTIAPTETINHNARYIRVQSTLRGANPLGAYLVIVLSTLAVLATRQKRRLKYGLAAAAVLLALYATGSRSAWIGTALALGLLVWLRLRPHPQRRMAFAAAGVGVLLVGGGLFIAFRNNTAVENALLHTQTHSAIAVSSNAAHVSALRMGLGDVVRQPFGDGPGTAGPASVYNGPHSARIAENYFVQIAQETGWLGLALLLSIMVVVALDLYRQWQVSPLALMLLVSLAGLTFVNMLSHAWVDDTLAYIWWGLTGIALALPKRVHGEV